MMGHERPLLHILFERHALGPRHRLLQPPRKRVRHAAKHVCLTDAPDASEQHQDAIACGSVHGLAGLDNELLCAAERGLHLVDREARIGVKAHVYVPAPDAPRTRGHAQRPARVEQMRHVGEEIRVRDEGIFGVEDRRGFRVDLAARGEEVEADVWRWLG